MFSILNHYLIILLGFLLPLSVAGGNLIAGLIIILWFVSGNYRQKITSILNNKFAIASFLFFLIHIISLIWSQDIDLGIERVKKMLEFGLLIPILISVIHSRNKHKYLMSFLISMAIVVTASWLIFFQVIYISGINHTNPTPFSSHISHGPMVAITFYISSLLLFSQNWKELKSRKLYSIFLVLLSVFSMFNVIITLGRAGQIIFVILFILFFTQFFGRSIKSISLAAFAIFVIFSIGWLLNSNLQNKFDRTITNIENIYQDHNTSLGRRFVMLVNSFEVFKKNPFFGVGIGSFPDAYEKVMIERSQDVSQTMALRTKNPHNMYALIAAEMGVFGLIFLLNLYYQQFKLAQYQRNNIHNRISIALLISFIFLNLSDSYFLGHFSSFLYAYLVSIMVAE